MEELSGKKLTIVPPKTDANVAASSVFATTQQVDSSAVKNVLGDPVYSGIGTWIGTLLSIAAAVIAWRQAIKAVSIAAEIRDEQSRELLDKTRRHLEEINRHIKPIFGYPNHKRGVKPEQQVQLAQDVCHEVLCLPRNSSLNELRGSIAKINVLLDEFAACTNDEDKKTEVIRKIQGEIQTAISTSAGMVQANAVTAVEKRN